MDRGTKVFLGWTGIVLGLLVFIVPLAQMFSLWANYILGILIFLQGIWLLNTR